MLTVLLVIHILIAAGLITVVLLQKSEGPMGGAMSGIGSISSMSQGRARPNPMTRITTVLGIAFFASSIGLALLAPSRQETDSILTVPDAAVPDVQAPAQDDGASDAPVVPTVPTDP